MTPTIPSSSTLAALLRTYCAKNVDGASRNAIDSVGQSSMQNIACATNKNKTDDVAVPVTRRKQAHDASASASTRSSRTSLCARHAVPTGSRVCSHAQSVREMTCMPAALFPSPPL